MIGSDLIKFESWIKCADSTVPLIGRKCTHTHANSCISSSIYNLFNIKASYLKLHVAVSKKRAADLKLFNGSHRSKKKKKRQSGIVLRRPLIVSCLHSGFLRWPTSATAKLTFPRQNLLFHGKTYFSTAKLTFPFLASSLSLPMLSRVGDPGIFSRAIWRMAKKIMCA